MKSHFLLLFAVLLLSSETTFPESQSDSGKIILTSARIFDVNTGQWTLPQTVIIEDSRISFVGTIWDAPLDGHIIDCRDKFVLPGLFDCHTHLAYLTVSGDDSLQQVLGEFVARGITQVRDVGGPIAIVSEMSRRITSGEISGPEMFYTGPMLEKSPLTWESENETLPGFTVPVDSDSDVDSILPTLAQQGACCVKTFSKFDSTVYRHLVDVARQYSLKVVHDPGAPLFQQMPMDKAIEAGITCIEHATAPWQVVLRDDLKERYDNLMSNSPERPARMTFLSEVAGIGVESVSTELLKQLAAKAKENGVFLCPTLNVLESIEEEAVKSSKEEMQLDELPEPMLAMIRALAAGMRAVGRFFVTEFAGDSVRMLVGQDGINPAATFREMKIMHECGIDEAEIIRGATLYPAQWLGEDNRFGSIAPGKQANILIIDADPLEDIGNLESVFLVLQNGQPVSP